VPLGKLYGLAGSVAQVIELGPPCFAASNRLDIENIGRMQWEYALDALIGDDPPDCEVFINAPAFAGYNRAGKYLRPLLVALLNAAVYFYDIAYLEMRDLLLERLALDGV
jgi:hypothetical protein